MLELHIDLKNGTTPAATITNVAATDNGAGIVRCTKVGHGFSDGFIVQVTGSLYVGAYIVIKINDDVFDLTDCVYTANSTLTSVVHIAGSTWATAVNKIFMQNVNISTLEAIVKVAKTPIVNLGINANFTNLSNTVVLASALTKVVDDCIGNTWTASTGVTGKTSSVRHLGATSQQFLIGNQSAFTIPGKVAYKAFGTTQDFSAYSKLSFWFGCNMPYYGIQLGSCFKICLCSDSAGNNIVNELPLYDVQGSNNLCSMVLDYGSALGSGINSVALYATSECRSGTSGTISVFMNNIVACNYLHHESCIGKNNGKNFWSPIKYIDGTTLAIMANNTSGPTAGLGYEHDTTETATIYAIEGISFPLITASLFFMDCRFSVAAFRPDVKLSFGWDTVGNVRDGFTYLRSKSNYGISARVQSVTIENVMFSNATKFLPASGSNANNCIIFSIPQIITDVYAFNAFGSPFKFKGCFFYNILVNDSYYSSLQLFGAYSQLEDCYFGKVMSVSIQAVGTKIINTIFDYCTVKSIYIIGGDVRLKKVTFNNSASNAFPVYTIRGGAFYMEDCTIEKVPILTSYTSLLASSCKGFIHRLNGDEDANYVFNDPFLMYWQTAVKQTGAVGAWVITCFTMASYERDFKIAEIAVEIDVPVTFRVWLYAASTPASSCTFVIEHGEGESTLDIPTAATGWIEYYIQIIPTYSQVAKMSIRVNNFTTSNEKVYVGSISIST